MAVRSRRFHAPVAVTAGAEFTLYTVPPARTAIIRGGTVYMNGGIAAQVDLLITPTETGIPIRVWGAVLSGGQTALLPYLVLNPGDVIRGRNGSPSSSATFTTTGSLLFGGPS